MSKAAYLSYLEQRLADLQSRIEQDKERVLGGTPEEKVKAAGDLAIVESRLSETKEKLAKLQAESEGALEDLKSEVEEDFDNIEAAFNHWIQRQDAG